MASTEPRRCVTEVAAIVLQQVSCHTGFASASVPGPAAEGVRCSAAWLGTLNILGIPRQQNSSPFALGKLQKAPFRPC